MKGEEILSKINKAEMTAVIAIVLAWQQTFSALAPGQGLLMMKGPGAADGGLDGFHRFFAGQQLIGICCWTGGGDLFQFLESK